DERVASVVAEVLADGARSIGGDVLHRSRFGSRRCHDDGVIHRAVISERLHDVSDRRALLANGAIDTNQVVGFVVQDRVERNRRFAGLAVPDDQLALSTTNRNHRIDGFDSGRHRLAHRLTIDNARSDAFNVNRLFGINWAFIVDCLPERVHYASNHGIAYGHGHDLAGAADFATLFDLRVVAHEHATNLVFFEVHRDAGYPVAEVDELAGHDFVEAVDAGDTIAQRDHGADFVDRNFGFVVFNLLTNELGNFVCFDLCHIEISLLLFVIPSVARNPYSAENVS